MRSDIKSVLSRKQTVPVGIMIGTCCIIVLLAVMLIITSMRPAAMNVTPDAARDSLARLEYDQLNLAMASYDTIGYPNADITGDILPTIDKYLNCAYEADKLLIADYGAEYSLFDDEIYRYMLQSMQEIKSACEQGISPTQGIENLGVYVLEMRALLPTRFDQNGSVLPSY